jgi:hypothetical protein
MGGLITTPNHGNISGGVAPFYPYSINYACRFNDDDSAALDVAAAPAMDDAKIYSFSFWCKRCNLGSFQTILSGGTDGNNQTTVYFDDNDKINMYHIDGGATTDLMTSTQVFRDVTNWYHFFVLYDSTDGTAGDRQRIWMNGVEITAWDSDDQAALNKTCDLGGNLLNVGCRLVNDRYFDGYLAEVHFIDGLSQAHTDFGEFYKGVWRPKSYTGSYGTAGFYLDFANSADFLLDFILILLIARTLVVINQVMVTTLRMLI